MASYSDFLPYVLPYVPGCPDLLAETYVRDICIDFCAFSLLVQKPLDPIDVEANTAEYEFTPPAGTDVVMPLAVWFRESRIEPLTGDAGVLRAEFYNSTFSTAASVTGRPTNLIHIGGNSFLLYPVPDTDEAGAVTVYAALKPSAVSVTCDDRLFREYAYEIGQGAVGRLAEIPGQPFTNPNAGMFTAKYLLARNQARLQAGRSQGRTSMVISTRRGV